MEPQQQKRYEPSSPKQKGKQQKEGQVTTPESKGQYSGSPEKDIPMLQSPSLRKKQSVTKNEFETLGKIGRGAYGNVYLVRKDDKLYAMKQIQKKRLVREHKQYQALIERELLSKIKHPGVVQLYHTFQDAETLYFIMEYCEGGSFTEFIKKNYNQLTNQIKIFYIAEIVVVLEFLHRHGITHRDLKPENLMLSKQGHLKVIDFGTAEISRCDILSEEFKQKIQKQKKYSTASSQKEDVVKVSEKLKISENKELKISENNELKVSQNKELKVTEGSNSNVSQNSSEDNYSPIKKQRRSTFVGTAFYISPQLIEDNICEAPSDLWALGCILYQIFYKESPFKESYEYVVFEKIKEAKLQFPKNEYITEDAINLIKRLIVKDPTKRLGCCQSQQLNYNALKSHPFFKGINFKNIFEQSIPDTKQYTEMNQEDMVKHNEKMQRTQTQMQKIIVQEMTEGEQKDKVLIHGVLEKKTFITYTLYYFVVYKDLSVKRVKCEGLEKEKVIQIRWKPIQNTGLGSSVNLSSSIKLFPVEKANQNNNSPTKDGFGQIYLPCKISSGSKFQVTTDQKTYTLKATSPEEALKWVKTINQRAKELKSQYIAKNSDSD